MLKVISPIWEKISRDGISLPECVELDTGLALGRERLCTICCHEILASDTAFDSNMLFAKYPLLHYFCCILNFCMVNNSMINKLSSCQINSVSALLRHHKIS